MNHKSIFSLMVIFAMIAALFGAMKPNGTASAADIVTLTLPAVTNSLAAGQTFTADVSINTGTTPIRGIQFDINYDAAVVTLTDVVINTSLWKGASKVMTCPVTISNTFDIPGDWSTTPGKLIALGTAPLGVDLGLGCTGNGKVATLTFTVVANGRSNNSFSTVKIPDTAGSFLPEGTGFSSTGNYFQIGQVQTANNTVASVTFAAAGSGQFTTSFVVSNTGGANAPAETATVTATGATPDTQSVPVPALDAGASTTVNVPGNFTLSGQSATITVALASGSSKSATYSPVNASGTTNVDATVVSALALTVPAQINFGELKAGPNNTGGNINVKSNTNYQVDVYDNGTTAWHMTEWNGTTFGTLKLAQPLTIWASDFPSGVTAGTPAKLLTGGVAGQVGEAGQDFPTVWYQTLQSNDPVLPAGETYHLILTYNAYPTL